VQTRRHRHSPWVSVVPRRHLRRASRLTHPPFFGHAIIVYWSNLWRLCPKNVGGAAELALSPPLASEHVIHHLQPIDVGRLTPPVGVPAAGSFIPREPSTPDHSLYAS
jgi:hypothetical protein